MSGKTPAPSAAIDRISVVTGHAAAWLDGRTLPGQNGEDLVHELRALLGEGVEISIEDEHAGQENQHHHPLMDTLISVLKDNDPQGIPIPYLTVGFTDASEFGRLVPFCFGFNPVRFPISDGIQITHLFHAHDERIHVPGFRWGLRVLYDAVTRWCVKTT